MPDLPAGPGSGRGESDARRADRSTRVRPIRAGRSTLPECLVELLGEVGRAGSSGSRPGRSSRGGGSAVWTAGPARRPGRRRFGRSSGGPATPIFRTWATKCWTGGADQIRSAGRYCSFQARAREDLGLLGGPGDLLDPGQGVAGRAPRPGTPRPPPPCRPPAGTRRTGRRGSARARRKAVGGRASPPGSPGPTIAMYDDDGRRPPEHPVEHRRRDRASR